MGLMDRVAIVQSDYRDLLRADQKTGGLTLEEEALFKATSSYSEDTIVNLAIALEFGFHMNQEREFILRDAIAVLDHLDTLGMVVRFKKHG